MYQEDHATRAVRAVVVGYGAYGRMHATKYWRHPDAKLVAIVEREPGRRRNAAAEFPDVKILAEPADIAPGEADVASVVVPATRHAAVSWQLLQAGLHLLVEKPFTSSLAEARELMRLADGRGLLLQPGYLERFNLTLGELHEHLPDPRYVEARRLTTWRGRGADVSVVLDLMIHDIDMLLAIVRSPLLDLQARGVKVVTDHWDVANAQLRFANGCFANLTASRASPAAERRLHVFAQGACALADIDAGEMLLHQRNPVEPSVMTERRFLRHEDPLAAEIDAFIQAVRHDSTPLVDADDACRALDIAEHIHAAMEPDDDLVARTALPLTDSERAIAYLLEERRHGLN